MGGVGRRLLFNLRNKIFNKLQELPVAFFNQNKAGDLISRINNDTDKLNQFFSQALMQFISNIMLIVGTGIFLVLVATIVLLSIQEWFLLVTQRKPAVLHETEPVWLPDYALKEGGPNLRTAAGAAALALGLAKELSGETQFERAKQQAGACEQPSDQKVFSQTTEERFNGVRRCC